MSGLIEWIIFLLLSVVAVVTAAGMLLTMSMYRAGLALMASFIALAGLFVLLDADLLAVIQIMMNVGGMLVMVLFMVMLMIDPGGEMMWDMKRKMRLPGPAAFSMAMPRHPPPEETEEQAHQVATTSVNDWTCPMHPEISAAGPGECPICGMDLVPRAGANGSAAPSDQSRAYTCPMHPEVRQDQAGECPLCGMDLVPTAEHAAQAPPAATPHLARPAVYTCPMHPEIQQAEPGECPLCGMDLVPAAEQSRPAQPTPLMATGAVPLYTCPMHPEIQQAGPGECPICGMDLVPMAIQSAPPLEAGAGHAHGDMVTAGVSHPMTGSMLPEGHSGKDQHEHDSPSTTGSGLSPRAHYEMMAGMAMSTAQLPLALGLGAVAAGLLTMLVIGTAWPISGTEPTQDATAIVGELLLSRYMIAFEGAAVLILAGIVGAVIFGKREAVPAAAEAVASAPPVPQLYTCPMHPEVQQAGPGECPMCGMDLIPAAAPHQATAHAESAPVYTCPMHPEVRQDGPGECPLCGMDLVPTVEHAAQAPPAATPHLARPAVYTCSMHPEIQQAEPGECPLCGMDLVPAAEQSRPAQPTPLMATGAVPLYTCPMHPEIQQAGPGECPICGMDLVPTPEAATRPEQPDAGRTLPSHSHLEATMNPDQQPTAATTYTCPMHPEVRQNEPGRCPKCGMHLVPAQDQQTTGGGGHPHGDHQ